MIPVIKYARFMNPFPSGARITKASPLSLKRKKRRQPDRLRPYDMLLFRETLKFISNQEKIKVEIESVKEK
jgi:hypothetical protein